MLYSKRRGTADCTAGSGLAQKSCAAARLSGSDVIGFKAMQKEHFGNPGIVPWQPQNQGPVLGRQADHDGRRARGDPSTAFPIAIAK